MYNLNFLQSEETKIKSDRIKSTAQCAEEQKSIGKIMIDGKVKSVLQQLVNEFSGITCASVCYYCQSTIEQTLFDSENER